MTSGLENLEHTVQLTHVWINELDDRLGWNNKPRSYRLLKAVLHALRDWLPRACWSPTSSRSRIR